jgi:hypothetical protein
LLKAEASSPAIRTSIPSFLHSKTDRLQFLSEMLTLKPEKL